MKNDSLGFGFIALGVFLYVANFVAAVIHMPAVTSWSGGPQDRLQGAYAMIGRQPMFLGAFAFSLGVFLVLTRARRDAIKQLYRRLAATASSPQTPDKAPEPTSGTATPPAEPGVAPVSPVALGQTSPLK